MNHHRAIRLQRERRRYRVRKRFTGTPERPRLSVFRSHKHIYAQLIDDTIGRTLLSASTAESGKGGRLKNGANVDAAREVGKRIGTRAVAAGIVQICFDRGPFQYHGRVEAVATAARAAGLQF